MHDTCDMGCACCGHEHEHSHGEGKAFRWLPWLSLGLGAACLGAMLFLPEEGPAAVLLGLGACLLAGHRIFWRALRALVRLQINEGIMMLVAAIACFVLGDFREAAAIAVFFALGEQLEELASARSRRSIAALSEIRPDTALLRLPGGQTEEVSAGAVAVGSEIFVPPHGRVPLDGVVLRGASMVDTASLTGESLPRETVPGDALLSGFVNGSGGLVLRTTAVARDSAASRLLDLVEHATRQKGASERFLARFARIYTPVVMVLGTLLAVLPSLFTGDWGTWVPRGLVFLVSACPCAIVLSVPLSFFAGIGGAARRGALVKGGRFVELLAQAETFAFDKTGTLTTASLQVTELLPCEGVTESQLMAAAAAAEQCSAHPIARAILAAAGEAQLSSAQQVEEQPGGGVRVVTEAGVLLCGSKRMLAGQGVDTQGLPLAQVYVARDGKALGAIRLESALHPEAPEAIARLRKLGVKRLVLLTGDEEIAAARAAEALGFDEVHGALLPEEKLARLQQLKEEGTVAYVGDGINDAPVLALADVGVAMGSGAQLAAETADMVLAGSSLRPLAEARSGFMRTRRVIAFNVGFALAIKLIVVVLGMFLSAPPIWLAVFADVGVMVLTVANAARLLRPFNK